jgi:hypothetical protein
VSWASPQAADNCGYAQVTQIEGPASGSIFPVGATTITYSASDSAGNDTTHVFIVTVLNASPVLSNLQVTASPVAISSTVSASAQVADDNATSATINWGDGATTSASLSGSNISGTHAYSQAGTFTITVTVKDACNVSSSLTSTVTVTGDNTSGGCSVTANGWFYSAKYAYTNSKYATGKAHFNIHAKTNGSNIPEGKASLNFQAGDLKFDSKTLESLQISGNRVVLKGTGTLNGGSGYRFTVTMEDEHNGNGKHKNCGTEDDKLRFRIWNASSVLVYDNQRGAAEGATPPEIEGGSIVIHKNGTTNARIASESTTTFDAETKVVAYPNPFIDRFTVEFNSDVEEDVQIHLLDVTGNTVYDQKHPYNYTGSYEVQLGTKTLSNDLYLVKVNQGSRTEILKVLHK